MQFVVDQIQWIMLVGGLLTLTMLSAVFAPGPALKWMFGQSLEGPLANLVVRNWGALIGMIGALLIWGAYSPADRPLILGLAMVSKLVWVGMVLSYAPDRRKTAVQVVVDLTLVVLFAVYLLAPAAP
jgi:hypothetical protein